jgi:hypothetical protein
VITGEEIIKPLAAKSCAFAMAKACYRKWQGMVSFEEDLVDYLKNGFVVSRPTCFGMAKIINLADQSKAEDGRSKIDPAWFVRIGVGDLRELLDSLPGYLPKIAFCRRNDGRMRVYPLDRLLAIAMRINKERKA